MEEASNIPHIPPSYNADKIPTVSENVIDPDILPGEETKSSNLNNETIHSPVTSIEASPLKKVKLEEQVNNYGTNSTQSFNHSIVKRSRLVIVYDKPRYTHMKMLIYGLQNNKNEDIYIIELNSINSLESDTRFSTVLFDYLNICVEYNDEFENNMKKLIEFIENDATRLQSMSEIAYHFHFDSRKKWKDYQEYERQEYLRFLTVLNKVAGDRVTQCSVINKYEINTIYLTERNDLAKLGQEIQEDIQNWKNLKIFDYGENCIRFFPGVKFPDSLEILNIGGGYSLETLAGFKMPPNLKVLVASNGSISSIDNVSFPSSLEKLQLVDNKIYFLNYVEFPPRLETLDVSQNRIDSLRGVNFPRNLKH